MAQKLTAKQEAFIRAYLKCGNASEAYRQAYDAKGMKPETINKRASELLSEGEIAGRIATYQAKASEKAVLSLADHLARLAQLSEEARQLEQMSAAIKAEELRGKATGLYVERVEHSGAAEPVKIVFRLDRPSHDNEAV